MISTEMYVYNVEPFPWDFVTKTVFLTIELFINERKKKILASANILNMYKFIK